jgi:transcriptional regulator of acetoin/glycerol metabolism
VPLRTSARRKKPTVGVALSRLTADHDLERHLDRVQLAPGFSYAEEFAGTNEIGTALESGQAAHVFGHEHYAGHLEDLACAAVPVRHPISGKAAGAVNLTSWRKDAGRLLIALAQSTARQVTQGLLNAPRKTPRPHTVTDRRIVRRSRAWRVLSWRGSFWAGRGAAPAAALWVQPTAGHR